MVKRLTRAGVGGYYMIEFQPERKAPHVHWILSQAVEPGEWGRMWVACSDQAGDTDALKVNGHAKSSQVLKTIRGASAYAAKYASKEGDQKTIPQGFDWSGRWWGHFGLPVVKPETVEHSDGAHHHKLRRLLRRKAKSEARSYYRTRILSELTTQKREDDLMGQGMTKRKARSVLLSSPAPSCPWYTITKRGRYAMGIEGTSKALRRAMAPYVAKPPRSGKDWDKLTCYGQAQFLRDNLERLRESWDGVAVSRALRFFGGKILNNPLA